jgi:chromosome segregation ATPase
MNRHLLFLFGVGVMALAGQLSAQAGKQLSPDLINAYDRKGFLTPNFKEAVHDLVNARDQLQKAQVEQKKFEHDLPDLEQQVADARAKTVALRQELSQYDNPEENDFTVLQAKVNDPAAKPEEVIELAQAYVWTYPASPHESDAQVYLATLQKKLADQRQAEKDSEAAREAAHAQLVKRAQAHDLSMAEWRDFLRGMSQDDLVKLFGPPSSKQDDYWYYDGEWVVIPSQAQKVGLQINFEAGRVITVDAKPPPP